MSLLTSQEDSQGSVVDLVKTVSGLRRAGDTTLDSNLSGFHNQCSHQHADTLPSLLPEEKLSISMVFYSFKALPCGFSLDLGSATFKKTFSHLQDENSGPCDSQDAFQLFIHLFIQDKIAGRVLGME